MDAVCHCRQDYVPHESFVKQSVQASQTQLVAITSSRSLDMNLVTEEGDKVTLSMDARASAFYASHGAVNMDDGDMHAQLGEYSGGQFERDISLSVEGDLNKQERREIRKVIKTINRMMKKFVQGKLNPMMAKAQKLQGLETIDSLEVAMSYEHQVLVAQQTQAAVSYDRTGEVTPIKPVAAGHDTQAPIKAEAPFKAEASIKEEARAVAEDMAIQVHKAQAPLDPLKALADRLLQAYRDQASRWNPLGGDVMDQIRNIFDAAVNVSGRGRGQERDDD